jgi:light-regulated signal transduction histidine kinase (bacteriophytochrome)
MKVSEVMTKQVAFCGPEMNLIQAVELMSKNACGFLPVAGEGGNVIGVITDRDISIALRTRDRRAAEARPRDAMHLKPFSCTADDQDLRRVNRDLETFAYSVSHDLQEPLRTIATFAQLLERSCANRLQPDESGFLARILTAADRMLALLNDLHTCTEATQHAEGPPGVDSGSVLAGVLENLRSLIEATGAVVTSTPLPLISMHESRLAQVFQNLISNAIKYKSSALPRIHISASVQDGRWVFSVTDNAIGIEPRFSEQIFGAFKRLHGREQYPGSGLGLAICQRILEQYDGSIWLEKSAPGEGSTFCFGIPSRNCLVDRCSGENEFR